MQSSDDTYDRAVQHDFVGVMREPCTMICRGACSKRPRLFSPSLSRKWPPLPHPGPYSTAPLSMEPQLGWKYGLSTSIIGESTSQG
jgi:hypothetical protein